MMAAVYNRIGSYEIHDDIGRGGMASVFLATDTRTNRRVALRVVSARLAQDVLEAEKWGAELQEQFCRVSSLVPQFYERGSSDGYLYVAMEYLDGEDLSEVIRRGPLGPERAVAIAVELCRFLEDARSFTYVANGREIQHLLHGDLTPANVRITSDGRTKVLDFGIAKALSLSRKVTHNDFGSVPYLSPERLESGGEMDATDGFWAVGVILYEMVGGTPPFRAESTRRLEELIRSRHPPASLNGQCPIGLQAVLAKLLGSDPTERYESAQAIREDLERYRSGATTIAEQEGWLARGTDEPVTRRTRPPAALGDMADLKVRTTLDDETTRRTTPASVPLASPSEPATKGAVPGQPASTRAVPRSRLRKILRTALLAVAIGIVLNETRVAVSANRLADRVWTQELDALSDTWRRYQVLSRGSLGIGVISLERSLVERTSRLTDRVIAKYRDGVSTVWEPEWKMARDALASAVAVAPGQEDLLASLRYSEGHLHRINGDARKKNGEVAAAQQEFDRAVMAFREAAQARPRWPDPFLGLARTFISSLADVDRGADALSQAEGLGYKRGERETAQLAEGYRERGDTLVRSSRQLLGMIQEKDPLIRAGEAYERALEQYLKIPGWGDTTRRIRLIQRELEQVQRRLNDIAPSATSPNPEPHDSGSGATPPARALPL